MAKKTTLILVWLAGDYDSRVQIDPLLHEVQHGLDNWAAADPLPDVFCFYHHWVRQDIVPTHSFRIERGTLQFVDGLVDPIPNGANELTGDIPGQVATFFSDVASTLCDDGPIRIVLAAHGLPGLGFIPTSQWILDFFRQITGGVQELMARAASVEFPSFQRPFVPRGTPPGGFTAAIGRNVPDLTLDQANAALLLLPRDRLKTILLHTCHLSGLEAISALRDVPHHIACESLLSGHLELSKWFGTLGDPRATATEITDACFSNIPSDPRVFSGRLSSQQTDGIDGVLDRLDALGKELCRVMAPIPDQTVINAIRQLWEAVSVTTHAVDIAAFCAGLERRQILPVDLLDAFTRAVRCLQIGSPPSISEDPGQQLEGLNLFLPRHRSGGPPSTDLPASVQSRAKEWCRFLDLWSAASS